MKDMAFKVRVNRIDNGFIFAAMPAQSANDPLGQIGAEVERYCETEDQVADAVREYVTMAMVALRPPARNLDWHERVGLDR